MLFLNIFKHEGTKESGSTFIVILQLNHNLQFFETSFLLTSFDCIRICRLQQIWSRLVWTQLGLGPCNQ